ncbi:MAG: hypothetical protein WAN65_09140 [Candidatus Sulfotelmatobacter sp.]
MLRATVTFLTTAEGGRKTPVTTGYDGGRETNQTAAAMATIVPTVRNTRRQLIMVITRDLKRQWVNFQMRTDFVTRRSRDLSIAE